MSDPWTHDELTVVDRTQSTREQATEPTRTDKNRQQLTTQWPQAYRAVLFVVRREDLAVLKEAQCRERHHALLRAEVAVSHAIHLHNLDLQLLRRAL